MSIYTANEIHLINRPSGLPSHSDVEQVQRELEPQFQKSDDRNAVVVSQPKKKKYFVFCQTGMTSELTPEQT